MHNLTLGLGGKFNRVFLGYYVLGANICDITCKYNSYVSYESRSVQYTLSKLTHDTLLGLNGRYQKPSDTDATYKDHVLIGCDSVNIGNLTSFSYEFLTWCFNPVPTNLDFPRNCGRTCCVSLSHASHSWQRFWSNDASCNLIGNRKKKKSRHHLSKSPRHLYKSPTTWVTLPILYQRVAVDP